MRTIKNCVCNAFPVGYSACLSMVKDAHVLFVNLFSHASLGEIHAVSLY